MASRNPLTAYRTKEIKAKKALPAKMHSQPIEHKTSRPRKHGKQKWIHRLWNKINQGQESMTSGTYALTSYSTK